MVNAAYDYYKNLYTNIYGDPAKHQTHAASTSPPKRNGLFNRQDISDMLDPENAVSKIWILNYD